MLRYLPKSNCFNRLTYKWTDELNKRQKAIKKNSIDNLKAVIKQMYVKFASRRQS